MKTMSALVGLATELLAKVDPLLPKKDRVIIRENLDCGEEGLVVDDILEWAIASNHPIDGRLWAELVQYFEPHDSQGVRYTKRLLEAAPHAT